LIDSFIEKLKKQQESTELGSTRANTRKGFQTVGQFSNTNESQN